MPFEKEPDPHQAPASAVARALQQQQENAKRQQQQRLAQQPVQVDGDSDSQRLQDKILCDLLEMWHEDLQLITARSQGNKVDDIEFNLSSEARDGLRNIFMCLHREIAIENGVIQVPENQGSTKWLRGSRARVLIQNANNFKQPEFHFLKQISFFELTRFKENKKSIASLVSCFEHFRDHRVTARFGGDPASSQMGDRARALNFLQLQILTKVRATPS